MIVLLLASLVLLATFHLPAVTPQRISDPATAPGKYLFDPDTGVTSASATTADGSVTRMTAGREGPVVFPPGFSLHPEAELTEHVTVLREDGSHVIFTMTSGASVPVLAEHYRSEAVEAGVDLDIEIVGEDAVTLAGNGFSFHARSANGTTRGQLSVATPALARKPARR